MLSVGVAVGYWLKSGPQQVAKAEVASATPIACTLNPDQRAARRKKLASFRSKADEIRELDDGYIFQFAFDEATLEEATRVILGESRCCSFLDFRLTARPSDDLLLLEVTGPEGTKEFLSVNVRPKSAGQTSAAIRRVESGTAAGCSTDGECSQKDCSPGESAN